jgi:hypothetical protein
MIGLDTDDQARPILPLHGDRTMAFHSPTTLGTTGISVGRLGVASSYRAPPEAYEEAFEAGCNYFTWGSFIRGRSRDFMTAAQSLFAQGHRSRVVLGILTYAHSAFLTETFLKRGLKKLGTDYADVLLLGYFSRRPPQRVLDGAVKLREVGMVRAIGITSATTRCTGGPRRISSLTSWAPPSRVSWPSPPPAGEGSFLRSECLPGRSPQRRRSVIGLP